MSKWNWQISGCLVMSQVEACALPPTNHNVKESKINRTILFFNGAWHCGCVRSRWRKCHVIVERATLLRAGCSLDLLGKDWECQPLTTCRPCWTRSLPHPESHSPNTQFKSSQSMFECRQRKRLKSQNYSWDNLAKCKYRHPEKTMHAGYVHIKVYELIINNAWL